MAAASLSREEQDRLVEAVKQGRRGAFERLYDATHVRVFTLAAHMVGDREEAADITQEVYLDVLRQLPAEGRHIRLEPWLFRLTMNTAYDHLRRRSARAAAPLTEDLAPATSDHLERAQLSALLKDCLASLTPRYRTAVVLRDICGVTTDELADVMGISRSSAAVVLFRARTAFKRAFREFAPAEAAGLSAVVLLRDAPELTTPRRLAHAPSPDVAFHASVEPAAAQHASHAQLATHAECATSAAHTLATADPGILSSLVPVADLGTRLGTKVAVLAVAVATVTAGGAALTTEAPGPAPATVAVATAPSSAAAAAATAGEPGGAGTLTAPQAGAATLAGTGAGGTQTTAAGPGLAGGAGNGTSAGGTGAAAGSDGTGTSAGAPVPQDPGAGQGGTDDAGAGGAQGAGGTAGGGAGTPQGSGTAPSGQAPDQPGQTPPDAGGPPDGQGSGQAGDAGAGSGTAATDPGPPDAPAPATPDPAGPDDAGDGAGPGADDPGAAGDPPGGRH